MIYYVFVINYIYYVNIHYIVFEFVRIYLTFIEIYKEQYERVESQGNSESKRDFRI